MQKRFLEYLKNECNCSIDASYLIAISGGVDSVVMAYLFRNSGIRFSMAHCNFTLRGEESDRDQQFVEDLATFFCVPCFVRKFDTKGYAEKEGLSIQIAARELRYEWFREVSGTGRMDYVAVGHNSDDVIETFIINLSRGTGIRGLTGIKPRNGNIIRPLLFAARKDILQFASENNISWRNDSSNESGKYSRNTIRNIIIPELERIYPAFRNNVIATIRNLKQSEELYNESLENHKKDITEIKEERLLINIEKLQRTGIAGTLHFEILKDYGCNQSMALSLAGTLRNISGKQVFTKTHIITRDRKFIIVSGNPRIMREDITIDTMTERIGYPFEMKFSVIPASEKYSTVSNSASLDHDKLTFPLRLRKWKEGDRFSPLGMRGTKKISDYLIDNKVPLPDKRNVWVLESGNDIVWLVGHRIDDRFKITPSTTRIFLAEKL